LPVLKRSHGVIPAEQSESRDLGTTPRTAEAPHSHVRAEIPGLRRTTYVLLRARDDIA